MGGEGAGARRGMDTDGVRGGYDADMLNAVCAAVNIPVIASGGAGRLGDFSDVFEKTPVDAALAASLFHYGILTVADVKAQLRSRGIPVR